MVSNAATPAACRTGDLVPFSEKKKNERGYSFGTADRVQPKEYISRVSGTQP